MALIITWMKRISMLFLVLTVAYGSIVIDTRFTSKRAAPRCRAARRAQSFALTLTP